MSQDREPLGDSTPKVIHLTSGRRNIFATIREKQTQLDAMVAAGEISTTSAAKQLREFRSIAVIALLEQNQKGV